MDDSDSDDDPPPTKPGRGSSIKKATPGNVEASVVVPKPSVESRSAPLKATKRKAKVAQMAPLDIEDAMESDDDEPPLSVGKVGKSSKVGRGTSSKGSNIATAVAKDVSDSEDTVAISKRSAKASAKGARPPSQKPPAQKKAILVAEDASDEDDTIMLFKPSTKQKVATAKDKRETSSKKPSTSKVATTAEEPSDTEVTHKSGSKQRVTGAKDASRATSKKASTSKRGIVVAEDVSDAGDPITMPKTRAAAGKVKGKAGKKSTAV
jgi:hypothetical protein